MGATMTDLVESAASERAGCRKTAVGVGLGLVLGAMAGAVAGLVAGVGIAMILGVL